MTLSPHSCRQDGSLVGTTELGGKNHDGTLFDVTLGGTIDFLHSFSNPGSYPPDPEGLTLGLNGNFYGTSYHDGTSFVGTIYELSAAGDYQVLHEFAGTDGANPDGALVLGLDGNFYGTTYMGGANNTGTVFKITPAGAFTSIYSFGTGGTGAYPEGTLALGPDGNFYGTTTEGGYLNQGTVFKVTPGGTLTILHKFTGKQETKPTTGLTVGSDGNLYGTVSYPANYPGIVFKIAPHVGYTVLHTFSGPDGYGPASVLVPGSDGNLYGVTGGGGANGYGTLYQITTTGTLTTVYSFAKADGVYAEGFVQHTNGAFYGSSASGGANDDGSIFSVNTGLAPFVGLVRPFGAVGSTVQILGQGLTGTTGVSFNGVPALTFTVEADTFMTAVVPTGATTGPVTITTPGGTLTSNMNFTVR